MKQIIAHPDNIELLKTECIHGKFGHGLAMSNFEFRSNPYLDIDRPTGKYVMPGGKAVARDQIRVSEKFIEYGPEDINWLLAAGIIHEEREKLFYVLDLDRFTFFPPRMLVPDLH